MIVSAAGGAAVADYGSEILGESTRSCLVTGGFIGGAVVAPMSSAFAGPGAMLERDIPRLEDSALYDDYIGFQVTRNLSVYFGAWQLVEGIKYGSAPNILCSLFASGLAVAAQVIGRRAKMELEARVRERTLL